MPKAAVDTEFLREKTLSQTVSCTSFNGEEIAAIDPLSIDDLTPLVRLLRIRRLSKSSTPSQDLEVLLYGMHCACAPVFDTQLAAAF